MVLIKYLVGIAGLITGEAAQQRAAETSAKAQQAQAANAAKANSEFAASQRATIDAILSKQAAGEQLTEDEQDQLNMYERDENGNIKVDENGNYKISEAGMAAYRQKAATRNIGETFDSPTDILRRRVETSRTSGDAARETAFGNRDVLNEYFAKRSR